METSPTVTSAAAAHCPCCETAYEAGRASVGEVIERRLGLLEAAGQSGQVSGRVELRRLLAELENGERCAHGWKAHSIGGQECAPASEMSDTRS